MGMNDLKPNDSSSPMGLFRAIRPYVSRWMLALLSKMWWSVTRKRSQVVSVKLIRRSFV